MFKCVHLVHLLFFKRKHCRTNVPNKRELCGFFRRIKTIFTCAEGIFIYLGYLFNLSRWLFPDDPLIALVFKSAFKSHLLPLVLSVILVKCGFFVEPSSFPTPCLCVLRLCSCAWPSGACVSPQSIDSPPPASSSFSVPASRRSN